MSLSSLIPEKYLFRLIDLKNIFGRGFAKTHYSQSGEDILVGKLFTKKDGFYVDVGAYHPEHYSNTYLLWKQGWRGMNIDPNPESISFFKRRRSQDINLELGVSSENKELAYYIFNHKSCNTFSREQKEKMEKRSYIRLLETRTVPCLPLRNILARHLPAGVQIDFMNIDVEGLDIEVLASNDWDRFSPTVIAIEDVNFSVEKPLESRVYAFLTKKGYRLFAFTGMTLIFKQVVN